MLHAMGAPDLGGIRELCAPSARYWQMGYELPLSGSHDLMDAMQRMPEAYQQLDGGLSYRIFGSTAEGNRVCLEAESHGVLSDGQPYTNQHHAAVHFDDDGRVTAFHDYLDTLRIYETLLGGHVNRPHLRPPSVSRPQLRSLLGLFGLVLRSARRIPSSDRRTRAPAAMTTLGRNRHRALAFLDAIGEQDLLKLASLYARGGTFWQIGDRLNLAGPHTQMAIADAVPRIYRRLPHGMHFEIHSVVAEGNRVAIESTSHAPLLGGGEYENQYNFLFRFDRDGHVQQFKEYWGTLHAYRTLFRETTVI